MTKIKSNWVPILGYPIEGIDNIFVFITTSNQEKTVCIAMYRGGRFWHVGTKFIEIPLKEVIAYSKIDYPNQYEK